MCFSAPKIDKPVPPPMAPDQSVQTAGGEARRRAAAAGGGFQAIFNVGGAPGMKAPATTTANAGKTTMGA